MSVPPPVKLMVTWPSLAVQVQVAVGRAREALGERLGDDRLAAGPSSVEPPGRRPGLDVAGDLDHDDRLPRADQRRARAPTPPLVPVPKPPPGWSVRGAMASPLQPASSSVSATRPARPRRASSAAKAVRGEVHAVVGEPCESLPAGSSGCRSDGPAIRSRGRRSGSEIAPARARRARSRRPSPRNLSRSQRKEDRGDRRPPPPAADDQRGAGQRRERCRRRIMPPLVPGRHLVADEQAPRPRRGSARRDWWPRCRRPRRPGCR